MIHSKRYVQKQLRTNKLCNVPLCNHFRPRTETSIFSYYPKVYQYTVRNWTARDLLLMFSQGHSSGAIRNIIHRGINRKTLYSSLLFIISGRMGASSELSPWFGVYGWADGHGSRHWTSSWLVQIVDDYRGTYSLPYRPLTGMEQLLCGFQTLFCPELCCHLFAVCVNFNSMEIAGSHANFSYFNYNLLSSTWRFLILV